MIHDGLRILIEACATIKATIHAAIKMVMQQHFV